MFKLANEIASAKHQESKRKKGALAQEHGIHAFVFLSFIFAEAVKLIVERWISIRALHPEDCGSAAVIFLIAITILSVQYWWVIYESAFFYGANLFNFSCGAIEAALFYAVCYLLREFDGLSEPFFVFGAMVISFILVDLVKHIEDENHQWKIGNLAPRQLFRLVAIIAAFLGGFADQGSIQVKYLNPLVVSSTLLALVVVYTVLTSYAHWVAVSDSKRSQGGRAA